VNGRVGGTGGGGGSAEGRHETARIVARDLASVVSELASLKGEIYRDLESRPGRRARLEGER
jgi:hypothetical protein